jgi:hypothetical protein
MGEEKGFTLVRVKGVSIYGLRVMVICRATSLILGVQSFNNNLLSK